jgi:hypothetical protein
VELFVDIPFKAPKWISNGKFYAENDWGKYIYIFPFCFLTRFFNICTYARNSTPFKWVYVSLTIEIVY